MAKAKDKSKKKDSVGLEDLPATKGKSDPAAIMRALTAAHRANGVISSDIFSYRSSLPVFGCPSLAFQYLINANGIPGGQMISMHGVRKTGKSTLSQHIGGWSVRAGGTAQIFDTEHKLNPATLETVGYGLNKAYVTYEEACARFSVCSPKTVEDWQAALTRANVGYIKYMGKAGPHCLPAVNIIDSISGANREELQDSILNGDALGADRSGQVTAKVLTMYLRSMKAFATPEAGMCEPGYSVYPVTTIAVCHADTPDEYGHSEMKGGQSVQSFTSIHLALRKSVISGLINPYEPPSSKTAEFNRKVGDVELTGRMIQIAVQFSALGPDTKGQSIDVPLCQCKLRNHAGRRVSSAMFDWCTADAIFLEKMLHHVKSVLTINVVYVNGYGRCYWAPELKALGYPYGYDEKTKVLADCFGSIIQNNKYLMEELQDALCIPVYDYCGVPPRYTSEKMYTPTDCQTNPEVYLNKTLSDRVAARDKAIIKEQSKSVTTPDSTTSTVLDLMDCGDAAEYEETPDAEDVDAAD